MQFPCCSAWCLRNRQSFCLIYHISFVINSVHIDIYEVCTLWLDGFHRQKYHSPSHPFPTIWYLKRDIFRYINDIFAYLLIILVTTSNVRKPLQFVLQYVVAPHMEEVEPSMLLLYLSPTPFVWYYRLICLQLQIARCNS